MSDSRSPAFDLISGELVQDVDDDVTDAPDGLRVKGALFAYEAEGALVVDLPNQRAEDLVTRGIATSATGRGTAKGAWVSIAQSESEDWLELATEAHQFVGEPAVGRDS